MKLQIKFSAPLSADGSYQIKAKDSVLGILFWGDEEGILRDWTALAYVPLIDGKGEFRFTGGRAVPPEATRVYARLMAADGSVADEISEPVPPGQKAAIRQYDMRFICMSDLHLNAKTWRLANTLSAAKDADALFLTGDMVNDGTSEQMQRFDTCLRENVGIPVLPVCGNHDLPLLPEASPFFTYADFENGVLKRTELSGIGIECPRDGIYIAKTGTAEIVGVRCVSGNRIFRFPDGVMDDLKAYFTRPSDGRRRILLCHAPLLAHNPKRKDRQPYMNLDHRLQSLLDEQRDVIFISGHLHTSPNGTAGNAELDPHTGNIYINNGSVCPNTAKWTDAIIPAGWTTGVYTRLSLSESRTEIQFFMLSGKKLSRGYYVFS